MTIVGENGLMAEAETLADAFKSRYSELVNELNELLRRKSEKEALIEASQDAIERVKDFKPRINNEFQCPACHVYRKLVSTSLAYGQFFNYSEWERLPEEERQVYLSPCTAKFRDATGAATNTARTSTIAKPAPQKPKAPSKIRCPIARLQMFFGHAIRGSHVAQQE